MHKSLQITLKFLFWWRMYSPENQNGNAVNIPAVIPTVHKCIVSLLVLLLTHWHLKSKESILMISCISLHIYWVQVRLFLPLAPCNYSHFKPLYHYQQTPKLAFQFRGSRGYRGYSRLNSDFSSWTEIWLTWYASSCCGVKMVCLFPISPWHKAQYVEKNPTVFVCEGPSATRWRCEHAIFQLWNACDNEDSGRTEVDQISLCVPIIMARFHRFHCPEWQALFGRECMLSVSGSASGTEPLLRTGGWRLRRESSYTRLPGVTTHKWVQEHKPS